MRITGRHFKTSSSRQADGHTGQRSVCSIALCIDPSTHHLDGQNYGWMGGGQVINEGAKRKT